MLKLIYDRRGVIVDKTLNNKGFTLVELISVMVILISISLVAVGGITESLTNRDIKECKEQQELAVSAAKIYFSLNDTNSVTISVLNGVGGVDYFKDDKKIDRLNEDDRIIFDRNTGEYSYSAATGSCTIE